MPVCCSVEDIFQTASIRNTAINHTSPLPWRQLISWQVNFKYYVLSRILWRIYLWVWNFMISLYILTFSLWFCALAIRYIWYHKAAKSLQWSRSITLCLWNTLTLNIRFAKPANYHFSVVNPCFFCFFGFFYLRNISKLQLIFHLGWNTF